MKPTPLASVALLATGSLIGVYFLASHDENGPTQTTTETAHETDAPKPSASVVANNVQESFKDRYRQLRTSKAGPSEFEAFAQIFRNWGQEAGEEAFTYALTLQGRERLICLAAAGEGWAKQDPEAAWEAILRETNEGQLQPRLLAAVLKSISEASPQKATQLLYRVQSRKHRLSLFAELVEPIADNRGRKAVLNTLLETRSEDTQFMARELFKQWGVYETEEPLAALSALADPELEEQAVIGMLEGWASTDGKAAFKFAAEYEDLDLKVNALSAVAKSWARSATASDIENLFRTIEQSEQSESIFKNIIPDLARIDPEAAIAHIQNFSDETARANHTRDALLHLANSDLEKAEQFFLELSPGKTKDYALWGVFGPSINSGVPVERIIGQVDSLENGRSIATALYSIVDYTKVADLGDRTSELSEAVQSYLDSNDKIPDDLRNKIEENLASAQP